MNFKACTKIKKNTNDKQQTDSRRTKTMYDYLEAMKSDIKDYIKNEVNPAEYSDREELETLKVVINTTQTELNRKVRRI